MPYTLFKSSLATIAFSSLSCLEAGSAVGQPFVYVGNASSATVSVIEATTNTSVTTIPVGVNPVGVAAVPSIGRIYVANLLSEV